MSRVSQIQLEANRANAKRSTGPRSDDGKAKSSRNAMKFGILSDQVLLPGEEAEVYESFRTGMYRRLAPRDELERMLADRVVLAAWKLRRVLAAEAVAHADARDFHDEVPAIFQRVGLASKREKTQLTPAQALARNGHRFEQLARYEAGLERAMYKAMAELRKVQAEREAGDVDERQVIEAVEPVEAEGAAGGKNEPISEEPSRGMEPEAPVVLAAPAVSRSEMVCKNEPIPAPSPGDWVFDSEAQTPRGESRGEGHREIENSRDARSPSS